MSLQIRRYQHGDREQVLRLHKVALEAVDAYVGPGPWEDDLDDIERSYLTPSGDFLVGVLGDDLAAMGALRRVDEDTAELKRMRVSPSLQRQGLGRQMLHALEARARDLGYTAIVPDTSDRANSRHRALPSPRLSRDRTNRTRRLANPVLPQNPWPCHNRERTRRSRGRQTGDSNLGITGRTRARRASPAAVRRFSGRLSRHRCCWRCWCCAPAPPGSFSSAGTGHAPGSRCLSRPCGPAGPGSASAGTRQSGLPAAPAAGSATDCLRPL